MSNPDRAPRDLDHDPSAVTFARRRAGYSKAALAREVGVSRSLICEIEKGTRNATPAVLVKLAQVLDYPRALLERKRVSA